MPPRVDDPAKTPLCFCEEGLPSFSRVVIRALDTAVSDVSDPEKKPDKQNDKVFDANYETNKYHYSLC